MRLSSPARTRSPGFVWRRSHGPIFEDGQLDAAVDVKAALAGRVSEVILDLTAMPQSADAILEGMLRRFDAPVADAPSYYLLQPTVFAFLSHLHRSGEIRHEIRDGRSLWTRV